MDTVFLKTNLPRKYDPKTNVLIKCICRKTDDEDIKRFVRNFYFTRGELKLLFRQLLRGRRNNSNRLRASVGPYTPDLL